ncbi:MAG: putative Fe-S cluster assembly protein SufT [Gammaproteobacteria bacterium RIFCSPHIGHO2_12_FULL_41_20]|nr:MAG: putative Fe-S cluster assembly protein SufT [Gammaproteobacteria bacterium RIFCSPHIGHO2_12_FULL_41_20]
MFHTEMSVEIQRDCDATLIPSGDKVSVKQGTPVLITQMLGSSYTVYVNGNLVRIAGKDGDALGLVVMEEEDINAGPGTVEDKVWRQLKTCFDPEIPVNIVDLGLVYTCQVIPFAKDSYRVEIEMTLTAPGCGMGPVLANDVEEKIRQIHDVVEVKVAVVFDPPWDRSMVSDAAKLQLGLL